MKFKYTLFFLLIISQAISQNTSLQKNKGVILNAYSQTLNSPSQITIKEDNPIRLKSSKHVISKLFEIPKEELKSKFETELESDLKVEKIDRYIGGVKVAHGSYSVLYRGKEILSIYAEHYNQANMRSSRNLTEEEALEMALPKLESEMFAWESTQMLIDRYQNDARIKAKLEKVLAEDYPKGEMVYVKDYYSDDHELELAYLFIIESVIPEFRDRIYVSANDGRILLRDPQLKHGVGDTRYSGSKSFPSTEITGPPGALYELKGTESISGVFCETRSMEGLGGLPVSSPAIAALSDSIADGDEIDPCLTDGSDTVDEFGDDVWNSNEHRKVPFSSQPGSCCLTFTPGVCDEVNNDDIALDAHWGASTVARYWKDIHNRFGYDDQGADIKSFVHHGTAYENASWNGMIMKYGDGGYQEGTNPGGMFGPLVSLDVCAHEIGHAICTSTSDLVYVGEPGALNEGLSDIWAATIESYVIDSIDGSLDYIIWGIGEQIDERDGGLYNDPAARALRWMDHPPAENNPDTYGAGTWWQDPECASPNLANDFCGVHFNSGVLNKWFYLLTVGSGQALSPGLNKPAFDDEINDKGDSYSVTGIGIRKTEKIVYGANLLLQPNSKFADMRAASIDIARSLYGPCSNEFEQTIRAWYAVGVGPDFGSCSPTIEFNQFNPSLIFESSNVDGCLASKEVNLSLFSYMSTATVNFTTGGNAVEGEDYELCVNSMDFNGDEEKILKIVIFDDKIIEGSDTIIVNFSGGGFTDSDTIIILNDDGIPVIGGVDTIFSETFDINDNSWQQELVNPTSLLNEWYIDAFNSNQAHISYPPYSGQATYTQIVESHVRLKSPLINGLGRKNINVSFNYQVGGERDLVDPDALFDFGTFEISYDGFDWDEIDVFVGIADAGGIVPDSGLYEIMLPQLDNSTFYLGYTWYNDALNGSALSFIFDNVVVEGEGFEIESDIGDKMETKVIANKSIAFVSENDTEVIAVIQNSKDDLGCTEISIGDNDFIIDTTASTCKLRSSKMFNFNSEFPSDSIQIELYFKESELDDWADFTTLNMLCVEDLNIENEASGYFIIDNADVTINDQSDSGNGYVSFTFWMPSTVRSIALTNRPSIPQTLIVMNNTDSDLMSLRYIIDEACPEDTIRFDVSTNASLIDLISGSILIDKNLHIEGNGVNQTIIQNDLQSIFDIQNMSIISLKNLSLRTNTSSAINNNGSVIVKDSVNIEH